MAYRDFKDLIRRTASDKIFCDKAFDITKNPKYDEYQRGLASMLYRIFNKKQINLFWQWYYKKICQTKNNINQFLEKFLKKSILIFYRQHLGADLGDIQLISKFNKGICFLLCAIDIFSKFL